MYLPLFIFYNFLALFYTEVWAPAKRDFSGLGERSKTGGVGCPPEMTSGHGGKL